MKGWKTITFNVLSFVSVLLAGDNLAQVVDPKLLLEIQAIINLALRFLTTTPVSIRTPKEG